MTDSSRPREYSRPVPYDWWLKRPNYVKFMVRELSSGFLAAYAVYLILLLGQARDPQAFTTAVESLKSPVSMVLHAGALVFALFNTLTTFTLAPRALVIHRGEEKVPDETISGAHYVAWAVSSLVVFALALMAR